MKPSVSVVIPTHKRSQYLKEAIDSVLLQDYDCLEVIVVDDNALFPDIRQETQNLLKEYATARIPVRAVYPDKNLGGALARNVGVDASSADYIAFLDDDDYFFQDKISHCIEVLSREAVDFVYNFVIDSENHLYNKIYEKPMFDLFVNGGLFATSQLVVNRECFLAINGFDDTPAKQDAILTFKLLQAGYRMACVPDVLNYYRNHDAERISNCQKTLEGEKNLFKKYELIRTQFSNTDRRLIEISFYTRLVKITLKVKRWGSVVHYFCRGLCRYHAHFVAYLLKDFKAFVRRRIKSK